MTLVSNLWWYVELLLLLAISLDALHCIACLFPLLMLTCLVTTNNKQQIKKKKRSRNVKQNKAEYVVEGSRVHMRKIQGVVMVHVGADWISFARYCADRLLSASSIAAWLCSSLTSCRLFAAMLKISSQRTRRLPPFFRSVMFAT